ncbi:alpha/beta hydrolase fold domain-containing protein [Chelativorans alearense]|uniref:alpha/beta hydrolase fold domain-containing protein n=1 Tax=Chelativorans alearense TaxID=2681495 RepID=UPI001969F457|nr:alpha/beta hydrolase fold domain-containing protein [Chelativorans alearense]
MTGPADPLGAHLPEPTAQMQALIERLKAQDEGLPDPFTLPLNQARAQFERNNRRWNFELPGIATAEEIALPAVPGSDEIKATLRVPFYPRPGFILYLHSGGWMFGSPHTHERAIRYLVKTCRMAVIVPLLPPLARSTLSRRTGGPQGGMARRARSLHRTRHRSGPDRHFRRLGRRQPRMATMLSARRDSGPLPDFAMLFYGVYGVNFTTPSYSMPDPLYGLTAERMKTYWDRYAPDPTMRSDPLAAPLNAPDEELAALPPLYLNTAELDPLRDDTLRLHERLRPWGVTTLATCIAASCTALCR